MRYKFGTLFIFLFICVAPLFSYAEGEPEDEPETAPAPTEVVFDEELPADLGKLVEVIYRWKEPQSSVDEIVYKRLIKTQGARLGCYYYSMYARCKDDILLGKHLPPNGWSPERILMGGADISPAIYKGIIESGKITDYRSIYYQQTPYGLIRLGEVRRGEMEFIAEIKFVRCIASEVGRDTPPTLWHIGALVSGSLALFDYFNPKEEKKNYAPVADFRAIPITGTINTSFYFDASVSTDADDPLGELLVRWDLDADGDWDNAFTFDKITGTQFALPGSYSIVAQVRDKRGAFSTVTKTVTAIAVGPGPASTPHPMFRNTITRTGVSAYDGPVTTTVKWSFLTGGQVESSPAIAADGTVYIGSDYGVLFAINPTAGAQIWTSPSLAGVVRSSPAIASDNTIYVGAGAYIHALNPADGSPYWSYNTGGQVRSSPVIDSDGTVYIGSVNGNLYAVNPDGSFKWSFATGGQIWSSPAIGPDGAIYVGSLDNKLYAINQNSTLKWSYATGNGIYSSPAVDNSGVVYIGGWDGSFYAVNPDGTLKWSSPAGGQVWSSAAFDGARVYFGSDDGKLYCRNGSDGALQWSYPAGGQIRSSPTVDASGRIYFGADDGKLYCLDSGGNNLSGWPIVLSDTGVAVRSTVAIANAVTPTLYVGSSDGKIYAVGAIALDPADIVIRKTANKTRATTGEVITYKIVIANQGPDPTAINSTMIIDSIPAGFKYLKSSTILSGVAQSDPSGSDTLAFDVGHFTPGASKTLTYQLAVGSGAAPGRYTNRAYAVYYYDQPPLTEGRSGIAGSEVWVVPDPLFDLGTIIGKVFWDKNANGIQDNDEDGYGAVQIIMEDGTIITADQNGSYHIPGVKPGTHLLHLKDIPVHWITTDSPSLVRMTKGLLAKANFGVHPADKEFPQSPFPFFNGLTFVLLGEGQIDNISAKGLNAGKQDGSVRDGNRLNGRLAYYLSGRIEDKFTIVSSLDTKRSAQPPCSEAGFRYIDPDKYHAEYGDNSSVSFDAANAAGPAYLKIESLPAANLGESALLYGSYQSGIDKTELATYHRTLSGVKIDAAQVPVYANERLKIKASGTLFAAQPADAEQIPAHNEFRATGASAYYLKNRDVLQGSERITIETRDKLTNFTLSARQLMRDGDYEIDYSNGRIIFRVPPTMADTSAYITSNNILGGNPVYIVADYEYAPAGSRGVNDGPYGGRLSSELSDRHNNKIQLGGTYIAEKDDSEYELKGADFSLNESAAFIIPMKLSLSAEYAESTSRGIDGYISSNGGLEFNTITGSGVSEGVAYKIKGGIKTSDRFGVDSYYQKVEPGFASSSAYNHQGSLRYGYLIRYDASEGLRVNLRYNNQELLRNANIASTGNIGADKTETGALQGVYRKDQWTVTGEYRYQEATNLVSGARAETNEDLVLGALKADYAFTPKSNVYAIQQSTLRGDANSQTTLGAAFGLDEKASVSLQAANGTDDRAFLIGVNNRVSDRTETFSNVSVSADKSSDILQFSNGASHQLTPDTRINARQDYAARENQSADTTQRSAGASLGQETKLSDRWQFWATLEQGTINDYNGTINTETIRESSSLRFRYADKDKTAFDTKLEARVDEGDVDKRQYLTANTFRRRVTEDITLSLRENYSRTENRTTGKTEALFNESGLGLALRPVKWDKWHLLAKYTYLRDAYPAAQTDPTIGLTKTLSNIYALETSYDLSRYFHLVEKYAVKDMKETAAGYDETENRVSLWINRINYNVLRQWYAAVEHRILRQTLGKDKKSGFLAEIMHRASKNIYLGAGYNFTDFSDDLRRSNNYSSNGFFIRINTIFEY